MPRRRVAPEPPIFTFRVRLRGGVAGAATTLEVWREIEIAANQTLADLGAAIPAAFDFDDPHLWSFFLSGKAWDRATEYALQGDAGAHVADRVAIRDVPLPGVTRKKEFLFLFDYGDEWHFGVKLVRVTDRVDPTAPYPRVVGQVGERRPSIQTSRTTRTWRTRRSEAEERGAAGAPHCRFVGMTLI